MGKTGKQKTNLSEVWKNSLIYLSTTILEKAVGFIMLPIYASQLGSSGYGILGMIEVTTAVLNILSKYGIAGAMNRFYYARDAQDKRNQVITTTVFIMLGLTTVTCTPAMVFSDAIGRLAFGTEDNGMFILLGVLAFMIDTNGFVGAQYLIIRQKALSVSLLSLLRMCIALSLNIYLIVVLEMGVLGVLYSHLITAIIFFIIFEGYVFITAGFHFNQQDAKELLSFFIPLIPGFAASFVRNNTDRIIIRAYLGLSQIGVYAMVMKFAMLIGLLAYTPFMKTWIPKRQEICEYPDGPQTISKVFTLHTTVMFFIGIMLTVQIPLLIKILTPPEFWISPLVAFFAVFSRIMFNLTYHLNFGLIYGKKTGKISTVLIVISILSVPAYIALIKPFGLLGIFMAAFCLYTLQAYLVHRIGKRYYAVKYEFRKLLTMFAVAAVLVIAICQLNLENSRWIADLKIWLSPLMKQTLAILNLDGFKEGKLLMVFTDKLVYVIEALIKTLLATSYLIFMLIFGVIKKQHLANIAHKINRMWPRKVIMRTGSQP